MKDAIAEFAGQFRGTTIKFGEADYDRSCKLYNGMIDKRPRLIARCADVADVIAGVRFGREHGLDIAVRGGGHNGPGLGSCDDGVCLDLGAMTGVRVDPADRTVRVGPGCTQGDVDHATHAFGLAVPAGIVSTTGIAGLTLGGGTGYLTRQYGLTIDNLLEADVVLADGSFVTANSQSHPDLFWALRGGGGNFGVVTSFLFRAHPVSTVFAGPVLWNQSYAGDLLRAYRDFCPRAPEELGCFLGLKTVPSTDPFPREHWGTRVCGLFTCFNGPEDAGHDAMRPIISAMPAPLIDWRSMMPFPALQSLFDGLLPAGLQWYWKGDFVSELTDAAIAVHLDHASRTPSELSLMHLYPIDGAAARVGPRETAWSARGGGWSMVITGVDRDPQKAGALKTWARAYWSDIHPHAGEGAYVNFMMDDEGAARVQASYGGNFERLRAIKRVYDPDNVFHVNQNIPPAGTPVH
jgi:FAD/FMN-containing dehydrogenase